ncbi:unnamed protein product [Blepharisma stoltei]|uniref:VHS domain-containing protein n=1 Tax=Blepharisma stoltei TaxID=1481888 RepID=A0AAU9JYX5_9CILI|nr:unnamed protein product [Blepharisma stoltei]
MNPAKPLDLVRMGCVSNEDYERSAPQLADIIKTAQMPVCRDVIALIKKIIKDKHAAPPSKLRALKLFHACMMVANTNFLVFAQRKVMSRFTILAKHKKQIHDDSRGDDIFGPVSGLSEENREASKEFLICLLQYIQIWAQQFGKAPDGKSSAYFIAYKTLEKENVSFPNKRNSKPRLSLDSSRQSLDNPRPSSAVPKQSSPLMYERPSQKPNAERPARRQSGGGIIGRVETAMDVYNDLIRSGGGGDAIVECFLQLKDLKSELEREVGQSDNPETIERLFELNDRLQMLIDSHHDIGKRPQSNKAYETVPVMQPQSAKKKQQIDNILDLDLFDDPQASSVSQSAAFSSMSFATHNPRLQMMPTEMKSPASQNYPALLPTSAKDDAGAIESLKRENEKLKKVISHRQDEDSNKINQINQLMTENMQLKQALEAGKQQMFMQDENIKKLTQASAQMNASLVEANQNIERLTRQLEAKENEIRSLKNEKPNGHQSSLSQHSLPMNPEIRMQAPQHAPDPYSMAPAPQRAPDPYSMVPPPQRAPDPYSMAPELKVQIPPRVSDPYSSSPNPFDDSDSSDDIPQQAHNFPIQNELFYRICNCIDRGILYDDEFLQVGIQIARDETGVMGMIYVGNKTPAPITELNTEAISYEKEGLVVLISPIISTDPITKGAQANRMVKASLKDFTGKIPKIIIKIKQGSETKTLFLNLPITIARFLQGIQRSPEEFWPIWERLAFKEEKFSCQMEGIRSMQELSQHLSLGGAFKIYTPQEIPQLSPTQLLGAGQKGVAVLILATIDPQTMSAQLSIRSESLTLREAIMEIMSTQISGKE